jgi:hypothetical protein
MYDIRVNRAFDAISKLRKRVEELERQLLVQTELNKEVVALLKDIVRT